MPGRPTLSRLHLVPSSGLVATAAVVLLPPALGGAIFGGQAVTILIFAALGLAFVAVADAALALGRAGGVSASIRPVTRLALGRTMPVEVQLAATRDVPAMGRVRVAIAPPARLGVTNAEVVVLLQASGRPVRAAWQARPRGRGVFRLGELRAERASPARLWHARWSVPLEGEVRVYPNLLGESRRLAALFIRKPAVGWRVQRQVGRGREFEQLREYLPGDGFDEIHWKATAKRGHPVTKVFQVERTQEVYAVVDASRLSGRPASAGDSGDIDDTLLERQINAALALALAAGRQGDRFGLSAYTDRPRALLRADRGAAHFQACREVMVGLRPEPVSPDLREVCAFLRARLTRRALLVFMASLDDPALADAFVEAVGFLARRHLVVVASPVPRDAAPLFSGEPPATLEGVYARLGGHVRWQGLQDLAASLHRRGVELVLLGRDELAAGAVSHYLALKQRQAI